MKIQIVHNGRGSGNKAEILVGGQLVYEGPLTNPLDLVAEFEKLNGATEVIYHSVTDLELDNHGDVV